MKAATRWFLALTVAQVLFLLGWAGRHEAVRQQDEVLLLKGRPVDPQDLLRGDHMILGYDISGVSVPAVRPGDAGRDVWVLLEKRGRCHEAVRAGFERSAPAPGQVLVRGTLDRSGRVNYGIGQYFVPEGKGTPRFNLMEIEVTVGAGQRLQIKRVLLDGTPYP
jgi:uncharacterized membrane-anchored protein